jgi:hypothetical protein
VESRKKHPKDLIKILMSGFWSPPNNPFIHPLYGLLPTWREPGKYNYYIYQFLLNNIDTLFQSPPRVALCQSPPCLDTMIGDESDDESLPIVEEQDVNQSLQQWFENDCNVSPTKRIQYLTIMMIAIDPTFNLYVPPFSDAKSLG